MNKKWYDGSAPIMASDEPESNGASIWLIVLLVLIISALIATPICLWVIPNKNTKTVNETVIHDVKIVHDTVVVHDTIRIQQTPVTFVCHGICNGLEEFTRN